MAKYFSKTELPFESIINDADSKETSWKGMRRKESFRGRSALDLMIDAWWEKVQL
jgi:hypothetical protein